MYQMNENEMQVNERVDVYFFLPNFLFQVKSHWTEHFQKRNIDTFHRNYWIITMTRIK
jgi:hypothetical protein